MSSIDGIVFTTWRGQLQEAARQVAAIPGRPGQRGVVVVRGDWSAREVEVSTTEVLASASSYAAVEKRREEYRAKDGQSVLIVDQHDKLYTGVVRLLSSVPRQVVGSGWIIQARWAVIVDTLLPEGLRGQE